MAVPEPHRAPAKHRTPGPKRPSCQGLCRAARHQGRAYGTGHQADVPGGTCVSSPLWASTLGHFHFNWRAHGLRERAHTEGTASTLQSFAKSRHWKCVMLGCVGHIQDCERCLPRGHPARSLLYLYYQSQIFNPSPSVSYKGPGLDNMHLITLVADLKTDNTTIVFFSLYALTMTKILKIKQKET